MGICQRPHSDCGIMFEKPQMIVNSKIGFSTTLHLEARGLKSRPNHCLVIASDKYQQQAGDIESCQLRLYSQLFRWRSDEILGMLDSRYKSGVIMRC